jgi:nitroreductase
VLIGLTSIHWREAWKYGERAYRYCQHDVGHVLGALAFAAAGLGWQARLLDEPGTDELAALMGVAAPADAEPEHPDCLVAVYPRGDILAAPTLPPIPREAFGLVRWQGQPNRLSPAHDEWRWVEAAADAAVKPRTGRDDRRHPFDVRRRSSDAGELGTKLRELIHRRRSAVEMDGVSSISRDVFYRMLLRTMPWFVPLGLLPWEARVHLGLFVHRVDDLASGVYLLARDPNELDGLRGALRTDAIWEKPPECPDALPLFLLRAGDARPVARQLSCGQDIAADGCFSVAMLTAFEEPLRRHGAWCYPRLYWECGVVGQILYLEAEAAGIRGTGIGCFFDDPVHAFFGLEDEAFQSLYHFTVGGPVDDPRLTTLPPYRDGGA